ncbi:MAG: elongation factor P [Proteobacteria bacterium]|nr:elongation factor P [Pseudomonadota bacterium]MBT5794160.1 elongation factor P [Deltaproteobacteria bacterium]MDE0793242.1 elongation factor P [SAR324 cluster bacterium]
MYETSDIRKGLRFEMDGDPFVVVEFQFVKPGKGTAFTRTKIRNMITGAVLDRTYKSGEKLKPADTEDREMQYLYNDGDFHFMDNNNYEQVSLDSNAVGDAANYLTENMLIEVGFFKGRSIGISLPNFVVLEVTETAPGEKGNTVTGASKPAVVSTGYSVNVPLFVNEGDQLRIDTRTGEYAERVKV